MIFFVHLNTKLNAVVYEVLVQPVNKSRERYLNV